MSIVDGGIAIQAIKRFYKERFEKFNFNFTEQTIDYQYNLSFVTKTKDKNELIEIEHHLMNIKMNQSIHSSFGKVAVANVISHRWVKVCLRDTKMSWYAITKCVNSKLFVFNFRNLALVAQYMLRIFIGK
jgi:hypothetical protein